MGHAPAPATSVHPFRLELGIRGNGARSRRTVSRSRPAGAPPEAATLDPDDDGKAGSADGASSRRHVPEPRVVSSRGRPLEAAYQHAQQVLPKDGPRRLSPGVARRHQACQLQNPPRSVPRLRVVDALVEEGLQVVARCPPPAAADRAPRALTASMGRKTDQLRRRRFGRPPCGPRAPATGTPFRQGRPAAGGVFTAAPLMTRVSPRSERSEVTNNGSAAPCSATET